jgi:predicted ribosomally synthesized peptide with nif11-like leader
VLAATKEDVMSQDSFREFYSTVVEKDNALKTKLKAAATPEDFMKIAGPLAKKKGHDFTVDDVLFVIFGAEIEEKDLEGVAGGYAPRPPIWQMPKATNPGGTCKLLSSAGNCCNDW